METRHLGHSDIHITPIIMGTWQAGKSMWTGIDDAEIVKALRAAFDAGITTFDTAPVYGQGHSERIIARALADVRQEVVYATKVFADKLQYDQVLASCHQSLKDLGTDYIDLLQIHWPAGAFGSTIVPVEETLEAMQALKQQGKIRAMGVSNFSRQQLEEASQYARIDSLQPPYSLFWRQVENDAMPYCQEHKITILAYSPLAQGLLTGKFGPEHVFDRGDHRAKNRLMQPENYARVQSALQDLQPIAERNGMTLAQLALNWLIGQPLVCAIAGARNAQQVVQNAEAAGFELDEASRQAITAIGSRVTDPLDYQDKMWDF